MSSDIQSQASHKNDRLKPGAIFRPINAASIGIVPDPHVGSTNGRSLRQVVNAIKAAAKFSFKGAPPFSDRYPLLNKLSPVVSNVSIVRSLRILTSIGSFAPVYGNMPRRKKVSFIFSATALITLLLTCRTLYDVDLTFFPAIGNAPSIGM